MGEHFVTNIWNDARRGVLLDLDNDFAPITSQVQNLRQKRNPLAGILRPLPGTNIQRLKLTQS